MSEKRDENLEPAPKSADKRRRQRGRSMFGPIILIAIGVALLLANLDLLPELNWRALLRLWPLILIFIGLDVIARQLGRPLGTMLSALVAVLAVVVFGYVLLFAERVPYVGERLTAASEGLQEERVTLPAAGIEQAEILIDFGPPGGEIQALEDSNDLIDAQVSYAGQLLFDSSVTGGRADVSLNSEWGDGWSFWSDPLTWFDDATADPWQVGLSSRVPTSLNLILGSGPMDMALDGLVLQELTVDGGSGSAELVLPDGDYDVSYDVGSGSTAITLPATGLHDIQIDGGSGRLTVLVPAAMAVRLTTEGGSGGLTLDRGLFEAVSLTDEDEGRWQTAGYDASAGRSNVFVDIGSGRVVFEAE